MTATTFFLRDLVTGRHLGAACVCVEARYASVLHAGAGRIERRFISASAWKAIDQELKDLASGPVPASSTVTRELVPEATADITIQMIAAVPIDAPPERVAEVLDTQLRALAPMRMQMRQERT